MKMNRVEKKRWKKMNDCGDGGVPGGEKIGCGVDWSRCTPTREGKSAAAGKRTTLCKPTVSVGVSTGGTHQPGKSATRASGGNRFKGTPAVVKKDDLRRADEKEFQDLMSEITGGNCGGGTFAGLFEHAEEHIGVMDSGGRKEADDDE